MTTALRMLSLFALLFFLETRVAESASLSQLVTGYRHACALLDDESLHCWGDPTRGQLGFGNLKFRMSPAILPRAASRDIQRIFSGYEFTCATFKDGKLKCWGANDQGQLGFGSDSPSVGGGFNQELEKLPYVNLGKANRVVDLFTGLSHACALLDSGEMKCWGQNAAGQLGVGDTNTRGRTEESMGDALPAVFLGPGRKAVQGCGGLSHTCAVLDDGSLKCWGTAEASGFGNGNNASLGGLPGQMEKLRPVDLGKNVVAKKVACGQRHTCALTEKGEVKCWGLNQFGVLGAGKAVTATVGLAASEMGDALRPLDLGNGLGAADLACGYAHCCALMDNAALKCWGYNQQGQLGIGDRTNRGITADDMGEALPFVDLGRLAEARKLYLGQFHTCARLASGEVKCWGWNGGAQLGNGNTTDLGGFPAQMGDKLPALKFGSH